MSDVLEGYQLQVELFHDPSVSSETSECIATVPLSGIDWVPVLEWVKWDVVSQYPRPPIVLDQLTPSLEPIWDSAAGPPYLGGLRATWDGLPQAAPSQVLPLTFLRDAVRQAAEDLLEQGTLAAGDRVRFRICATPLPAEPRQEREEFALQLEAIAAPLALREGNLSDMLGRSHCFDGETEAGLPVFLPQSVLDETHAATRAAGATETGGVLVGHLCLDRTIPEIYLQVTAQIPAVHAEQHLASLTLTHHTWAAVEAALHLRGAGEQQLGWWHSHPVSHWCADCEEEKRRHCRLQCDFFSAQDTSVQRCCFSRAFQIALVVSDHGTAELSTAMYGWRRATMQRRGFQVVPGKSHARGQPDGNRGVPTETGN